MKRLLISIIPLLLALAAGPCLAEQWETAPAPLPGVQAGQEKANYWIARHPEPDRVILAPEGIEAMNRAATGRPETELVDVFAIPDPMEGAVVRKAIAEVLSESRQTKGYDHTNRLITAAFYDRIESSVGAVPPVIRPAWGVITARVSLRRLPTNEAFYDRPLRQRIRPVPVFDAGVRKPRRRAPPDRRRQLVLRPDDLHDGLGPLGLNRHRGQADHRILFAGKAPRRHREHGPRLRRCGFHEPRRHDPHGHEAPLRGKDGAPLRRHPALEGARRRPAGS